MDSAAFSLPADNADVPPALPADDSEGPRSIASRTDEAGHISRTPSADAELQVAVDALGEAERAVRAAAKQVFRAVAELGVARFSASALVVYRDKGGNCYIDLFNEGRGRRLALLDKDLYAIAEHAACLWIEVGESRTVRP